MDPTAIKFTKMHGIGNDFMLVDISDHAIPLNKPLIQAFANRYTGVGFDQLLTMSKQDTDTYHCQIFNADGSEAEQCGNGLRCVARYLHENALIAGNKLTLTTIAGTFPLQIYNYDQIEMCLSLAHTPVQDIDLALSSVSKLKTSFVSLGNPHAIFKVASADHILSNETIAEIQAHASFPQGVNIGFVEVINPTHIRLRTIERGAGETNACGSNACASVIAGISAGWLDKQVTVQFRLGSLQVAWEGPSHPIFVTGPAAKVYEGIINIK